MARCTVCGQALVRVTYGPEGAQHTLLLSAEVPCFAAAAFDTVEPQDGDKVFKSLALPLHSATCPGQRKGQRSAKTTTPLPEGQSDRGACAMQTEP